MLMTAALANNRFMTVSFLLCRTEGERTGNRFEQRRLLASFPVPFTLFFCGKGRL
jgi:hypothetical protein